MKNLLMIGLFSQIIRYSKISTELTSKSKEAQLTLFMLTVLTGILGILQFFHYLVYTILPSVWHWGFESTTTLQEPTIQWDGFTSQFSSQCLVLRN